MQISRLLRAHEIVLEEARTMARLAAKTGDDEMFLVAGSHAWLLRGSDFMEIGTDLPPRLTNVLQEPIQLKRERVAEFFALPGQP